MKLYNKDSKFAKKPFVVIFESFIYLLIIVILLPLATPSFKRTNIRGRTPQVCASDIRVLTGAVEMYNMDNATFMQDLNQNILLQGHYIKEKLDDSCIYKSLGNLAEDGIIYCETHGDVIGVKIKPEMSILDYQKQKKIIIDERNSEKEKKQKEDTIKLIILIALILSLPLFHLISNMFINETKSKFMFVYIEPPFYVLIICIIAIFLSNN